MSDLKGSLQLHNTSNVPLLAVEVCPTHIAIVVFSLLRVISRITILRSLCVQASLCHYSEETHITYGICWR